jgi:hypothetical protein
MIYTINKGIIWEQPKAQIILNPVSVSNSVLGKNVFNNLLRETHREVYDEYLDYMVGESPHHLLGDIQLVKLKNNKIIMNGFMYKEDEINLHALAKVLVELYNLADEYKLNIAIPVSMNNKNQINIGMIRQIIDVVFDDFPNDVYLYQKTTTVKSRK